MAYSPKAFPPERVFDQSTTAFAPPLAQNGTTQTPSSAPPLEKGNLHAKVRSPEAPQSSHGKAFELSPSAKEQETITKKMPQPPVKEGQVILVKQTSHESDNVWGQDPQVPSSPFATRDYEEMTKSQRSATRALVKDFVRAMVKGKEFCAVMPDGKTKKCFCALNRALDKLLIRAKESDKTGRTVSLENLRGIVVGNNKSAFRAVKDLKTPLDDMCVTLVLDTEECITFRMDDAEGRDRLASCLTMFSESKTRKSSNN